VTFLERFWAYVTLGAMGYVWEEASPLIGGLAAHDRHLRLISVVLAVAFGTWVVGVLLYMLGRSRGRYLRKRWPKLRRVILQSVAVVRRHPWRASLLVRFAYGLRLALPIACGIGRVPIAIFTVGSAISAVVWSAAFAVLGWALGRTTQTLIGHVRQLEPLIGTLLVLAMIVGFVVLRRRHVAEKTTRVIEGEKRT